MQRQYRVQQAPVSQSARRAPGGGGGGGGGGGDAIMAQLRQSLQSGDERERRMAKLQALTYRLAQLDAQHLGVDENGREVYDPEIYPEVQRLTDALNRFLEEDSGALDDDEPDKDHEGVVYEIDFDDSRPYTIREARERRRKAAEAKRRRRAAKKKKSKAVKPGATSNAEVAELRKTVDRMAAVFASQVERERDERDRLSAEAQRKRDMERLKYVQLMEKMEEMNQRYVAQQAELEALRKEYEGRKLGFNESETEARMKLRKLLEEANALLHRRDDEIERLKRGRDSELERVRQERNELEDERHRLRRQLERAQEEIDALRAQVRELTDDNMRMQAAMQVQLNKDDEISRLESIIAEMREKHAQREDDLRNKLKEAHRKLHQLADRVHQAKTVAGDEALAALASELDTENPPSDDAGGLFVEIVFRYMFRHFRRKYYEQRGELEKAELDMRRMPGRHKRQLRKARDRLQAKHDAELERLRKQIEDGIAREQELAAERDEWKAKHKKLFEKKRHTSGELEARRGQMRALEVENEELRDEIERLRKDREVEPSLLRFAQTLQTGFKGYYLPSKSRAPIRSVVDPNMTSEYEVVFGDYAYTRGALLGTRQKRVVVVTKSAVFLLQGKRFRLERGIRIADIKGISLPRGRVDVICLHHISRADLMLEVPKRFELLYHILGPYERIVGQRLRPQFGERIFERTGPTTNREIEIDSDQEMHISSARLQNG